MTRGGSYADAGAECVAGSIDLVVKYPDGGIGIIDWKRAPKLRKNMWGFRRTDPDTMRAPLDHLDECDGAFYALQVRRSGAGGG